MRVWSESVSDPARVAVHVADEGQGISLDLRDRIFEPFFTTKPDGSGIGLSLALRTVEDHGGRLFLEKRSEIGVGAAFVVELPVLRPGDRVDDDSSGGGPPAGHIVTDASDSSEAHASEPMSEQDGSASPVAPLAALPATHE